MTNIIFLFGTLSGLIVTSTLLAAFTLLGAEPAPGSEWLGYLGMIVALSLIFVGVKRYRDRELGGVIKFLPAFLMGLAIAAVASVIYVLVWEVYMAATDGAFFDVYMQAYIDGEKAKGLSGAALDKLIADMEAMKAQYNSSQLFRIAITFTEIFPVGFVIALISAALLQYPKILPARA